MTDAATKAKIRAWHAQNPVLSKIVRFLGILLVLALIIFVISDISAKLAAGKAWHVAATATGIAIAGFVRSRKK